MIELYEPVKSKKQSIWLKTKPAYHSNGIDVYHRMSGPPGIVKLILRAYK